MAKVNNFISILSKVFIRKMMSPEWAFVLLMMVGLARFGSASADAKQTNVVIGYRATENCYQDVLTVPADRADQNGTLWIRSISYFIFTRDYQSPSEFEVAVGTAPLKRFDGPRLSDLEKDPQFASWAGTKLIAELNAFKADLEDTESRRAGVDGPSLHDLEQQLWATMKERVGLVRKNSYQEGCVL